MPGLERIIPLMYKFAIFWQVLGTEILFIYFAFIIV